MRKHMSGDREKLLLVLSMPPQADIEIKNGQRR